MNTCYASRRPQLGAAGRHQRQCRKGVRWTERVASAQTESETHQETYDWQKYRTHSSQRQERAEWAASVRRLSQGIKQRAWEQAPQLDPPAVLADVVLVLVGPKNPANVGTIARSCSAFECLQMRIVESRCEHTARNARSAAKGAQYILYQAQLHDDLRSALADCHVSVAFTRWVAGRSNTFRDITGLLGHPAVRRCLELPAAAAGAAASGTEGFHQQGGMTAAPAAASQQHDVSSTAQPAAQQQDSAPAPAQAADASSSSAQALGGPPKLALVFGREELGLSDDELAACDLACSIPIGRLQESLSLGHAVTVVLSQLYQARQELGAGAADDA